MMLANLTMLSETQLAEATNQEVRNELIAQMKQCRSRNDLPKGKLLHSRAVQAGYHTNMFVATALISMYGKCGNMKEARKVFDNMRQHDVVSWTALILGYAENGESTFALAVFSVMDAPPNHVTFVAALRACVRLVTEDPSNRKTCLERGESIHRRAADLGLDRNVFVASTLVDMYCKCGSMPRARAVFDGMSHRNVVSWTVLLLGYVDNGESSVALKLFDCIECAPNHVTFVAALKACAGLASESKMDRKDCLVRGQRIHRQATQLGFDKELSVANTLMDMYTKCGSMEHAQELFDRMTNRDVVSWNIIILGYVENGDSLKALGVFRCMDCSADHLSFVAAIKACQGLLTEHRVDTKACLEMVVNIHVQARDSSFDRHVFVGSSLIDVYSRCGSMPQAREVFENVKEKNVVAWTALMLGYVENGQGLTALEVFHSMDCAPNHVTFMSALKACIELVGCGKMDRETCLRRGVEIHRQVRKQGFDTDISVSNTLIEMYSGCGEMRQAKECFDRVSVRDAMSWNVLIFGYVESGDHSAALDVFNSMDCAPESVTFVAVLKACSGLAAKDKTFGLRSGFRIHKQAEKQGFEQDVFVGSTLVDMYSKCGDMVRAREVFDSAYHRNVVFWNVLIAGYVENGMSSHALGVFHSMDCAPDKLTLVAALKACASLGALEAGRRIHFRVCKLCLEQDEMVANCLVDFYGKCGYLTVAEELFNSIHSPSLVSWTALIGGYSSVGNTSRVFGLVKKIREAGLEVDSVTFLSVLTACSHAGMVEQGRKCFNRMVEYGVRPSREHYTCMADMLSRANRLEETLSLIRSMPFPAKSPMWMTLLGACQKWSNLEIGKLAFHELLVLDDKEHIGAAYVLMGNIFESLGNV